MPSLESLLAGPARWAVPQSAVNAQVTATKAAQAGYQHFLTGVSISASGQPLTSVQVLILDGVTILDQWEIPPATFGPIIIEFKRPYISSLGAALSVQLGALGAGIRGTVTIRGFTAN